MDADAATLWQDTSGSAESAVDHQRLPDHQDMNVAPAKSAQHSCAGQDMSAGQVLHDLVNKQKS